MNSLEEDHCWKCPMHSTSNQANCKEVHAWLKIQKALEEGVWENIRKNRSEGELEAITARFLEKRFKKEKRHQDETLIIIKTKNGFPPDIPENSALLIKPQPQKVKKGDLVLLPLEMPCPVSWFFKAGLCAGVPFLVARAGKVYHQGALWYLKTVEGLEIPVHFILGVVLQVLDKKLQF